MDDGRQDVGSVAELAGAPLSVRADLVAAVPLGAPLSLHTGRPGPEIGQGSHRTALLRRRRGRNSARRLLSVPTIVSVIRPSLFTSSRRIRMEHLLWVLTRRQPCTTRTSTTRAPRLLPPSIPFAT